MALLVPTGTKQEANSLVLISSEDRLPGNSISSFYLPDQPNSTNLQYIEPISFDSILFIETLTTSNNSFVVNGVTITLTPGYYNVSSNQIETEIQTQLNGALGPIVFTVTNVSNIPNVERVNITSTAPFTIDQASLRFMRATGLFAFVVPSTNQTFNYTILTPTAYFDVVASQIHRGVADDSSSGIVNGVLFRIQLGTISTVLKDVVTLQQSDQKKIFFPQATAWPVVQWQLLDEWRTPIELQPNSIWWVILKTGYIVVQRNATGFNS
jgi:hypothetical protein